MGFNLHRIASGIDTSPILRAVERESTLFNEHTARQKTPGSPHRDTFAIFLRWCESKEIESVFTDIPAIDYPAMAKLPEAEPVLTSIIEQVEATELGRVMIAMLKPGGFIAKHIDEGAYADHYERFHLVLSSEDGNKFYVESEPRLSECAEMRAGELWWFNHKQPHWVWNGSSYPRLHLIVDMVASKWRRERKLVAA